MQPRTVDGCIPSRFINEYYICFVVVLTTIFLTVFRFDVIHLYFKIQFSNADFGGFLCTSSDVLTIEINKLNGYVNHTIGNANSADYYTSHN